jgi:hypothetical protein
MYWVRTPCALHRGRLYKLERDSQHRAQWRVALSACSESIIALRPVAGYTLGKNPLLGAFPRLSTADPCRVPWMRLRPLNGGLRDLLSRVLVPLRDLIPMFFERMD